MIKFFENFQKNFNCISFVSSWNPIKTNTILKSIPRIDTSKLFLSETIFDAFSFKIISDLDTDFLEKMRECHTVFLNTIDRCAATPISISKINTLYYELLRFYKSFFEENLNLTHIFFPATPHFPPDIILFYVSKYFNKKTIILTRTDFDNKYVFNLDWRILTKFEHVLNKKYILIQNSSSIFTEHSKKLNEQSLLFNFAPHTLLDILKQYYFLFNYAIYIYKNKSQFSPIYLNNGINLIDIFYLIINRFQSNKILFNVYTNLSEKPNLTIKYVYFALHFQPERSTQPEGSFFENQLLAIRLLEKNLPRDYMIYVKEHPRQFDNFTPDLRKVHSRIPEFYKEINKLSKVKLINIDFNSFELINNARIVATITGSSGWQALKNGKPIFIFGYPWYSSCFGTFVIKNSIDVINALVEVDKLNSHLITKEVEIFVNSIKPYLVDGYTGIKDINGMSPNLDLISEKFSTKLHSYALQFA